MDPVICRPFVGPPVSFGHRHDVDCLGPFPLGMVHAIFVPEFGAKVKPLVRVQETQGREKTIKAPRHRQVKRMDKWA